MFDETRKYKEWGHFFFRPDDNLALVCNAPADKSGIYIVNTLAGGRIDLVYIGKSGRLLSDGSIFIRKAGMGGIKDRLVNGHQFGKKPRRISWPEVMKQEGIEALDIYWYVTHNENYCDDPSLTEKILLRRYFEIYGRLPLWNRVG